MKIKKALKIAIIVIVALALLGAAAGGFYKLQVDPYRGTVDDFIASEDTDKILTMEEAKEDIVFVIKKVRERHPAWLEKNNTRVTEVENRYAEVISGLKDEMTVMDVYRTVGYMLNPLYDGHTFVYHCPSEVYVIDDFSYMEAYGVPVLINGEDTEDVVRRYLSYESYEMESAAREGFFNSRIIIMDDLKRLGIDTSEGVDFTYLIDGVLTTIHHDFVIYEENDGGSGDGSEYRWVYYSIDEENDLGVFTLETCINNDLYKMTVKEFFEQVAEKGITNIAIDLRDNGGGNSSVATEFIRYLDVDTYKGWDSDIREGNWLIKNRDIVNKNRKLEPAFSGNVYVLTNRGTFSSAMDFTMYIMDNGLGKVVGEASSNLPDSYGDCLYFHLPNTKLNLSISYKKWYRIDKSKSWLPLEPDFPCDPRAALDKVYELIAEDK